MYTSLFWLMTFWSVSLLILTAAAGGGDDDAPILHFPFCTPFLVPIHIGRDNCCNTDG